MASKGIAISTLVLRIITLLCLAACVVLIVTDNYKLSDGSKTTFKDIIAYRYVLATALIGFVYTLFQTPFALYHACTDKRLIRNVFLAPFDFYADKIMSFLLATGVGAGFAVSFELKRIVKDLFVTLTALGVEGLDEWKSKTLNFFDRGNIATALLFVGFISMAILSLLSSITRNSASATGLAGFFFR